MSSTKVRLARLVELSIVTYICWLMLIMKEKNDLHFKVGLLEVKPQHHKETHEE